VKDQEASHENAKTQKNVILPEGDSLFDRVSSILEQARANVVRAVNANMVLAYWLIGREIVQALQGGESRAEYGKQVIEELSGRLRNHFGRGFSTTNLRYFRTFYTVYADRLPEIRQIGSGVLAPGAISQIGSGILADMTEAMEAVISPRGFSPALGWSHYQVLMGVENPNETIARYSVLNENRQIFASQYMLYLPTEEELRQEIEKERRRIEGYGLTP